jgi:RNA polymerase sigma factor (TIGR02999 family)
MSDHHSAKDMPQLLLAWRSGEPTALDQMLPLVYDELRRLAAGYLRRERPEHTLQPTALVHEAYLRLLGQKQVDWRNRAHFLGVAAGVMRRILVNHARDRRAAKRPGDRDQVSLSLLADERVTPDVDVIALEEALEGLAGRDPRMARVVELRFFGGLTMEEIAEVLEISRATVERDWNFARTWLYAAIEGTGGDA